MKQLGIRALIGTHFAGIFFDNCQRNGVLAIELPEREWRQLAGTVSEQNPTISVDLPRQQIRLGDGSQIDFTIDALRKQSLMQGLDAIGSTLQRAAQIREFEASYHAAHPWLR